MRSAFLPVIPVIIVSLAVASRGIAADPPAPAAKLDAFGHWVMRLISLLMGRLW